MQDKLYRFESLVFRINKLEREKIRVKSKYHRINSRIHKLVTDKNKTKKEILKGGNA